MSRRSASVDAGERRTHGFIILVVLVALALLDLFLLRIVSPFFPGWWRMVCVKVVGMIPMVQQHAESVLWKVTPHDLFLRVNDSLAQILK